MKSFLFLLLISLNSFALDECGKSDVEKHYSQLSWNQVTDSTINSSYADVYGIYCIGTNENGKIVRFHYRDNQGVEVNKTVSELMKKDIVFFKQSDFPRAARVVTRSTPPLTLKITKIKNINGFDVADISVKFLRNVAVGFSRDDIKEIMIKYKVENNETSYKGIAYNRMYLNVRGLLIVKDLNFFLDSSLEKTVTTKYLKSVKRKL